MNDTKEREAFEQWYKVAILPVVNHESGAYTKEALEWAYNAGRAYEATQRGAEQWRPIESAPMGESGDESTYFIGACQDGKRINTATCYRNKHGAYEWWGGGIRPTHWQLLIPLPTTTTEGE